MYFTKSSILSVIIVIFSFSISYSKEVVPRDTEILSLDDLFNLKISAVSKREESTFDTAAASFVVTAEDIKSMGVTHVADALRIVPGVHVGKATSSDYAVGIRGFNKIYNSKLLVMIDGRSVYTPSFSGVFWNEQDLFIDNIQSIEVVRGSGGTVWGANAMNGVINIMNKSAEETQGTYVSASAGTFREALTEFRYGDKIEGKDVFYRVHGKYSEYDANNNVNGNDYDTWDSATGGIRYDWKLKDSRDFFVDVGGITANHSKTDGEYNTSGGHINSKWQHVTDEANQVSFQSYYSCFNRHRNEAFNLLETRFDIQYQQSADPIEDHDFIWGLGFRRDTDEFENTAAWTLTPTSRDSYLYSAFFQDRISLKPDMLDFIVGTKIEHHAFAGVEYQPNAKLLYQPSDKATYWTSVSRSVRSPSRTEKNMTFKPSAFVTLVGNEDFSFEEMMSYEFGARYKTSETHVLDVAVFYNQYDDLLLQQASGVPGTLNLYNTGRADVYGAEIASDWQPVSNFKLRSNVSMLKTDGDYPSGFDGLRSPEIQLSTMGVWQIDSAWTVSGDFRYVHDVWEQTKPAALADSVVAEAYFESDLKLAWQNQDGLEVSLVGRNLLDSSHREFGGDGFSVTELKRSFYIQASYRY